MLGHWHPSCNLFGFLMSTASCFTPFIMSSYVGFTSWNNFRCSYVFFKSGNNAKSSNFVSESWNNSMPWYLVLNCENNISPDGWRETRSVMFYWKDTTKLRSSYTRWLCMEGKSLTKTQKECKEAKPQNLKVKPRWVPPGFSAWAVVAVVCVAVMILLSYSL